MDQKLQSFNFFAKVPLAEKGQSTTGGSPLNQLDISSFIILGSKFYAVSKKNNCINVLELTTDNAFGLRLIGQIVPYNERLDFVEKCIVNGPQGKQQYLVTYGLDNESQGPSQGLKATYVKFWEHEENISLDDLKNLKPKKSILVGKISVPLLDCFYFAVAADLSAFALASKDGVHIYKSKNVLTDNPKESVLLVEKGPARFIGFAPDPHSTNVGLYVGTSTTVLSFPNITKEAKKRLAHLQQGSFKHFDINQKGELYCITDANVIQSFTLLDTVESWPYDEDKQMIRCFGQNYLIASIKVKRDEEVVGHRMIIYDLANQVLGYNPTADVFPGIIDIFVADNNAIYAVIINQKGEKLLNKFVEEDNTKKLEKILTKNCFDIAYRFASNQQYDPMLLAEISLCNANHHYAKKDYQKAINEYKKTAGTTQPSSVIMKFLDVSQIDYLIQYLEHIHEKKLANKDHTALLLNCYVKQKNMEKFEEFLNNLPSFKSEIFDTKAAVKECRDLKHIDLALKLALQCDHEDLYIRILIEDKKDYLRALEQIRQTRSLENKIRYIREYGQTFMKNEPAKTLDLLQKMITLSSFRRVSFASDRALTPEERDIFEYLNLPESDKERLNMIIFPRPDEFFHFFVGKNQYLENYLEFLKNNKTLALEKAEKLYPIFHKMFEYYLEQYSNYKNMNAEILKYRESADDTFLRLENKIIHLLEAPEHDKKYDKNHILVLFKMYKFGPGVVILCKRMGLREELLDYYIEEKAFEEIIDLCKNFGGNEINLWVQALKFFSKLDKKERSFIDERGQPKTRITQALDSIQNIEALSPLLVLNILGKAKNLSLGEVKRYFQNRLVENTMDAQKNWRQVQDQTRETDSNKAEYKRLKTQAKKFVSESCSANCGEKIMLHDNENAVYFLCGCTYHQNCLEETDEPYYECRKCADDRRTKTNIVNDLKAQSGNSTQFFEKLEGSKNKFDVISEFMGKGLFGTFQSKEREEEDL